MAERDKVSKKGDWYRKRGWKRERGERERGYMRERIREREIILRGCRIKNEIGSFPWLFSELAKNRDELFSKIQTNSSSNILLK